jgi:hypothetical protein
VSIKGPDGAAGTQVEIGFDPSTMAAQIETINIADEELRGEWGKTIQKIVLAAMHPAMSGTFEYTFKRK